MRTFVLSADEECAERVRELTGDIEVAVVEGPVAERVRLARQERPEAALGFAARRRTEVIEAIEAGADEALLVRSAADARELVDRTVIRGAMRREIDLVRASHAHSDKLASLGTLVAGVAHEVNNQLHVLTLLVEMTPDEIRGGLEALERVETAADRGEGLASEAVRELAELTRSSALRELPVRMKEIATSAAGIRDVVQDLRSFALPDEDERTEPVRVNQLVDEILRLAGRPIRQVAVLEREFPPRSPVVRVARSRLVQVLTNVLANAAHAIGEVSRPVHRVRVSIRADEEAVAISIADTGPGIAPEIVERIFEPFFTTKRATSGTGLGLALARNLMRGMGGDLVAESVFGDGATFVLLLPRAEEDAEPAFLEGTPTSQLPVAHRLAVLVLDDDDQALRAYTRVLSQRYDLALASHAAEAIALLDSGSHADVVVADVDTTLAETVRLHAWLSQHRPALASRMVALTVDARQALGAFDGPGIAILRKPISVAKLVEAIDVAGLVALLPAAQ